MLNLLKNFATPLVLNIILVVSSNKFASGNVLQLQQLKHLIKATFPRLDFIRIHHIAKIENVGYIQVFLNMKSLSIYTKNDFFLPNG